MAETKLPPVKNGGKEKKAVKAADYTLAVLELGATGDFNAETFTVDDMEAMDIIVDAKVKANTNGNLYLSTKNSAGERTAALYFSVNGRKGRKVGDVLKKDDVRFYFVSISAEGAPLDEPYFVIGRNGNGGEFTEFED